ncbi:MAG: dicarboxylate/amino acid:cation symporter [Verrucomicrobia bacterium]|nr:dicarboxylate/amino acid:cation symporter [Verrucomicrobiota bacterium]
MWGMVLGLALGLAARLAGGLGEGVTQAVRWTALQVLDPVGQVFLRTLFFVVVPLIFASLALGVVQLGRLDQLGPLAGRTFALFGLNMAIGVALGLVIMNTVRPGYRMTEETKVMLLDQSQEEAGEAQARAAEQPKITLRQLVEMFMPRNLFGAVADFQILPLIVFALLVGAAGTQLADERRRQAQTGLAMVTELMTRIVHFAMLLAPVAVAAMIASQAIKAGVDILQALLLFVLCALGGMVLHLFGTMSLLLRLLSRRSPRQFFRAVRTVLVTAFSTSSSSATLPTTILVSREQLGVSASTAGFVLPLGATMNMSGTALYEGCVVLFVAQVYSVPLTLGSQITLLLLTVLSAVAVAGIPGASLPLIVGLLATFKIPPEGIALILGVDRLLDMARTVLNVGADMVVACIVDERLGQNAPAPVSIPPPPARPGS